MQDRQLRTVIAALGRQITPTSLEGVHELFAPEQLALAKELPARAVDQAYGPDPRHRLDIYTPACGTTPAPVMIWVHGGGFRRGSKGAGDQWQNANAGRMAAQEGMVGVVINYRLAPQHRWPTGSEDLSRAVAWTRREVAAYGGDPDRIFVAGTSAGAAHVAGYLKLEGGNPAIAGAIMLSGVYGVTPMSDERDLDYFGEDAAAHAAMVPLDAVVSTRVPLLLACSQYDPPRFQEEFVGVLQRRLQRDGQMPRTYVGSGHNHFSLAYHLGTSDRRLADEIATFVAEVAAR